MADIQSLYPNFFGPEQVVPDGSSGPLGPMGPEGPPPGIGPDGHRVGDVYQDLITGAWVQVQPNGTILPYRTATSDTTGQIGFDPITNQWRYVYRENGRETWGAQAPAPSMPNPNPGVSTNYSYSFTDPSLLREQQRQFDAKYAQDQASIEADMLLKQRTYDWNIQKDRFAQSQDNKRLALEAQQQANTNAYQIATLQQQRVQLQNQRDQFNAQMSLETAKANAEYQNAAAAREAQATRDVAQFASNPIDYAKAAAYLTAKNGFGQVGVGGQNLTSEQSLQPLQTALETQQSARADRGASPYSFTPLPPVTDQMGNIDPNNRYFGPRTIPGDTSVIGQGNVSYGPSSQTAQGGSGNAEWLTRLMGGDQSALGDLIAQGFTPAHTDSGGDITKAAGGGIQDKAFISGEKGPEINIPLKDGKVLVLNSDQASAAGINLAKLTKMADGGVFDGGNVLNPSNKDTTQARAFIDAALGRSLQGTPWTASSLPSPVFASSPGVSPIVTNFFAGLNQLAGRLPADEFQRQASILAPVAYNRAPIVARSA